MHSTNPIRIVSPQTHKERSQASQNRITIYIADTGYCELSTAHDYLKKSHHDRDTFNYHPIHILRTPQPTLHHNLLKNLDSSAPLRGHYTMRATHHYAKGCLAKLGMLKLPPGVRACEEQHVH